MVASGTVNAGNAVTALKKHGTGAAEHLAEKLEVAKAEGKTKVTKKTLAEPKRDLVALGIGWIVMNHKEGGDVDLAVGLLSELTSTPVADICARFQAAVARG